MHYRVRYSLDFDLKSRSGQGCVSYCGKIARFEPNWPNFEFDFFKMSNIEFVPVCSIIKKCNVCFAEKVTKRLSVLLLCLETCSA